MLVQKIKYQEHYLFNIFCYWQPNDLHKLRGLTHSFALKHSPKIATARRRRAPGNPRGAPRTVSLMLGCAAFFLEFIFCNFCGNNANPFVIKQI